MIFCLGGLVVVGYFGLVYFIERNIDFVNVEVVFIELFKVMFNFWIVGIILFVIFVVIMSILFA